MDTTQVIYQTTLGQGINYDLENDSFRRAKMFEKIKNNLPQFKNISAFRDRVEQEMFELELSFQRKVQKWFTLKKQVEFLDKVISGELVYSEQSGTAGVEGVDLDTKKGEL